MTGYNVRGSAKGRYFLNITLIHFPQFVIDKSRSLSSVLRSVASCAPSRSVRLLKTVPVEELFSCRLITIFGYIVCEITGGFHIQRFRQRGHPSHPLRPLVSVRYSDVHCGWRRKCYRTDMTLCCCSCCYTYTRIVQPTDAPSCETAHPVH